jgi:hypothetical protein
MMMILHALQWNARCCASALVLIGVGAGTTGCAARGVTPTAAPTGSTSSADVLGIDSSVPAADTSLFEAVVKAIDPDPSRGVRIDPRPLEADPEAVRATGHLADVPEALIEQRRAVLLRLGVAEVDYLGLGPCAGTMVPPGSGNADRTGCPARREFVAITGLPRPGGAYWSMSPIDEREEGRKQGYWAVRVLMQTRDPDGASGSAWDYVFRKAHGGWELVKKQSLLSVD